MKHKHLSLLSFYISNFVGRVPPVYIIIKDFCIGTNQYLAIYCSKGHNVLGIQKNKSRDRRSITPQNLPLLQNTKSVQDVHEKCFFFIWRIEGQTHHSEDRNTQINIVIHFIDLVY